MADEINRASSPHAIRPACRRCRNAASPIAGARISPPAGRPFMSWRRRIRMEQEGTYPLPEAQLDRFLHSDRRRLSGCLMRNGACLRLDHRRWKKRRHAEPVMSSGELDGSPGISYGSIPVGDRVVETASWILVRAGASRTKPPCRRGGQTRSSPGAPVRAPVRRLSLAWRGRARCCEGRLRAVAGRYSSPSHKPVLRHRMALNFAARSEGLDTDQFIDELLAEAM